MQSRRLRILWLVGTVLVCSSGLWMLEPIPQNPAYHHFADQRTFFGIPNFLNVASNLPFILIGAAGFWLTFRNRNQPCGKLLLLPYTIFFGGVLLAGFGSSYYHVAPENETLVWDRYPITLAFMALFTAILMEHISYKGGLTLLLPLLGLGLFSVWYWHHMEQLDKGDLRLYIGVQFLPLVLILLIIALFHSCYTKRAYLLYALALYGLAKVLEYFDTEIFQATGVISGHTLKHLTAALAAFIVLIMYRQRQPVFNEGN